MFSRRPGITFLVAALVWIGVVVAVSLLTGSGTDLAGSLLITGDFDGDGSEDVLLGHPETLTTLRIEEWRGFKEGLDLRRTHPIRGRLTHLPARVLDANGDGRDDLLLYAAGPRGDGTVLLLGTQDGLSTKPAWAVEHWQAVVTGDLDQDGYDDAFFRDFDDNRRAFRGSDTGMVPTAWEVPDLRPWFSPDRIEDHTGDGIPDLYAGGVLYPGTGDGFGPGRSLPGTRVRWVGDLDGDERVDLVDLESPPRLLLGSGRILQLDQVAGVLPAGDIEGDHRADLLVWTNPALLLQTGLAGQTLMERSPFLDRRTFLPFGTAPHTAGTVGDFNGDGTPDILFGDPETPRSQLFLRPAP